MKIPNKFNRIGIDNENDENIPLTFVAKESNSSIKLIINGSLTLNNLQYKTNNEDWQKYNINDEKTLNVNDYIQFRNNSNTLSSSRNDYAQFVMSGKFEGSGNCQSLVNFSKTAPNYCFRKLFQNCLSLISAPNLYATTVKQYAYSSTFNTSGITIPPIIKAMKVYRYACYYMFENCNSLIYAPEIPATQLDVYCYQYMFNNCINLLYSMNSLPAMQLATRCYSHMFNGCSKLKYVIPILPSLTLSQGCYQFMFGSCSELIKSPELPAPTLVTSCYNSMFAYCYNLTHIKVGFTNWVNNCTNYWLTNGTTDGIFECPLELDTTIRDNSHIVTNWSVSNY